MRIRDFHAVDFDKDKIVHFFCKDGAIQLCDDFSHCGRFARTWSAGDVDTSTRTLHNGRAQMVVDRIELRLAAR